MTRKHAIIPTGEQVVFLLEELVEGRHRCEHLHLLLDVLRQKDLPADVELRATCVRAAIHGAPGRQAAMVDQPGDCGEVTLKVEHDFFARIPIRLLRISQRACAVFGQGWQFRIAIPEHRGHLG